MVHEMTAEEKLKNNGTVAHSHASEQTNRMGGSKRSKKSKLSLVCIYL